MRSTERVVIIGGGLSGLSCALTLRSKLGNGVEIILLESQNTVGGRVRSEQVDGFTLDFGFQVYLNTYKNAAKLLDLPALDLRSFAKGAVIHRGEETCVLVDPLREIDRAASMLGTFGQQGVLTARDVLAIGRLTMRGTAHAFKAGTTADEALIALGMSERMRERFWRPFFGGVFFDRSLSTDAAMLGFVFDHFRRGRACVPAQGMGKVTEQLGDRCSQAGIDIRVGMRAARATSEGVTIENGDTIEADAVVVATEGTVAADLLQDATFTTSDCSERITAMSRRGWQSTHTLWFAAPHEVLGTLASAHRHGILHLDGSGGVSASDGGWTGPINHLAIMTDVAPEYGNGDGRALICANTTSIMQDRSASGEGSDSHLIAAARSQLERWAGKGVHDWELLKLHTIHRALPDQSTHAGGVPDGRDSYALHDGVFVCGDHMTNASIDGAIESGIGCGDTVAAYVRDRVSR